MANILDSKNTNHIWNSNQIHYYCLSPVVYDNIYLLSSQMHLRIDKLNLIISGIVFYFA